MYIQITTRCNMSCEHCGMNCTKEGQDMSVKTWNKAIALAENYDSSISIGGGEPTLHKKFWNFLMESIGSCENVWLATNGSIKKTALTLAKMAQKGIIGCALSQDDYHDPIDQEVINAFNRDYGDYGKYDKHDIYGRNVEDCREIRDVTGKEINAGRCDFGEEGCVCPDIIIKPDGSIMACGCDDAVSFGHVDNPQIPENWMSGTCTKDQEEVDLNKF